jgi:hypothetical protein
MGIFQKRFASQPSTNPGEGEQAVLVYINVSGLPLDVCEEHDLATIEDQICEIIEGDKLGKLDGNEVGPDGAALYMRGPDAEKLFAGIESTLHEHPLCRGARVFIRRGGPGAPERVIEI